MQREPHPQPNFRRSTEHAEIINLRLSPRRPQRLHGECKKDMPTYYEKLKHLDHSYLWHPFTQMREWMGEEPCIISRGEGHYLIDVQGRKYLDGVSSLWCNVHGHRKKEKIGRA